MTIKNPIAIAHVDAFIAAGTVAQMIRKGITNKTWNIIGEAYGECLNEFGKRERIKGTKEFTASTPADTLNTQIQTVTSAMDCGKLKPVLISTDDGDRWGLEPVTSRPRGATAKKLTEVRESHAAMMEGRTHEEKVSEALAFAELLGVKIDRANVVDIKPATKPKAKGKPRTKVTLPSGEQVATASLH